MNVDTSLVVSTIGRTEPIIRLIHSLVKQQGAADPFELIVIDQSPDGRVDRLLHQLTPPIRWRVTQSEPGVSLGRNLGAAMGDGGLLAFPDDDCWYHPHTLAKVAELRTDSDILTIFSGQQVNPDGTRSMLRWPGRARTLNRRDVWQSAISSTLFIPRTVFDGVGGFDEELGVGARTPWQAAEDTDLLLRAMRAGAQVKYEPSLLVYQDDPRRDGDVDLRSKMLGYGRGVGRVLARNHYPRSYVNLLMARKGAASATRMALGRPKAAQADLAWANGVWHGYHDRLTV